jgi:hypothetical protein
MPEYTGCAQCARDVDHHGLGRLLEWDGLSHAFCSYLCEFLWRRARHADHVLTASASFPLRNTKSQRGCY